MIRAAEQLDATVANMRFVKPLDRDMVLDLANTHDGFVTLEDNVVAGGAGSGVAELLAAEGMTLPVLHLGIGRCGAGARQHRRRAGNGTRRRRNRLRCSHLRLSGQVDAAQLTTVLAALRA